MEAKLIIRDAGKVVTTLKVVPAGKNHYLLTVDGVEHSSHRQFGHAWEKAMWMSRLTPENLEELVLAPMRGVQA